MHFDNKYIIGITGGIGSGKTMVLEYLKNQCNCFVIEADKIGHRVMDYKTEGYNKIVEAFGEGIINYNEATPSIDRGVLGKIVFSDESKLKLLNSITHPLIYKEIEQQVLNTSNQIIVIEAAILLDSSIKEMCNILWYIYANMDIRLERLSQYRNISKEKALQVMKNQPTDDEFRNKCQVIIDNSYDKEETFEQIKKNLPGGHLWEK